MAKTISIYSTPTCHYCNMAKDFFKKHNISYTAFDVQSDVAKRQEMVQKSGQMGVPVILIDNELIVGFDEDRIRELLDVK